MTEGDHIDAEADHYILCEERRCPRCARYAYLVKARTDVVERRCYWIRSRPERARCSEPAKYLFDGHGYCEMHYGPINAELGINKPDQVVP